MDGGGTGTKTVAELLERVEMFAVPGSLTCLSQGYGEVVRSDLDGTLRIGNPLEQGAPFKSYCKHCSCSVNTKLGAVQLG